MSRKVKSSKVPPSQAGRQGDASQGLQEPRYSRIHRILVERIQEGKFPVGSLMPTEVELAAEFNTSRFTVREALRNLTEQGYVERRQGVGTRVISVEPQSNFFQSFDSLEELFQIAVDTYYVLMNSEKISLDEKLAVLVGGQTGERWIRIDGVRWTEPGGQPLCFVQSYIPERFEKLVPEFAAPKGPFFAMLERESHEAIEEVQQEIRAMPMPNEFIRLMGLRPGDWSLQLMRRYLTASGVLIVSVNWHPAERMAYTMRIQRNRQPSE